jgi:hypothetical protein
VINEEIVAIGKLKPSRYKPNSVAAMFGIQVYVSRLDP